MTESNGVGKKRLQSIVRRMRRINRKMTMSSMSRCIRGLHSSHVLSRTRACVIHIWTNHRCMLKRRKKRSYGGGLKIWTWTCIDILPPNERYPFAFIHEFVVLQSETASCWSSWTSHLSVNYDFVYDSFVDKTMPVKRHSILSINSPRGEIWMTQPISISFYRL